MRKFIKVLLLGTILVSGVFSSEKSISGSVQWGTETPTVNPGSSDLGLDLGTKNQQWAESVLQTVNPNELNGSFEFHNTDGSGTFKWTGKDGTVITGTHSFGKVTSSSSNVRTFDLTGGNGPTTSLPATGGGTTGGTTGGSGFVDATARVPMGGTTTGGSGFVGVTPAGGGSTGGTGGSGTFTVTSMGGSSSGTPFMPVSGDLPSHLPSNTQFSDRGSWTGGMSSNITGGDFSYTTADNGSITSFSTANHDIAPGANSIVTSDGTVYNRIGTSNDWEAAGSYTKYNNDLAYNYEGKTPRPNSPPTNTSPGGVQSGGDNGGTPPSGGPGNPDTSGTGGPATSGTPDGGPGTADASGTGGPGGTTYNPDGSNPNDPMDDSQGYAPGTDEVGAPGVDKGEGSGDGGSKELAADAEKTDPAVNIHEANLTDTGRMAFQALQKLDANTDLTIRDTINIKAGEAAESVGMLGNTALAQMRAQSMIDGVTTQANTAIGAATMTKQLLASATVNVSGLLDENVSGNTNQEKQDAIQQRRGELLRQYTSAAIRIAEGMNAISSRFMDRATLLREMINTAATESGAYGAAQDAARYALLETLRGLALSSAQMGVQASRLLYDQDVEVSNGQN